MALTKEVDKLMPQNGRVRFQAVIKDNNVTVIDKIYSDSYTRSVGPTADNKKAIVKAINKDVADYLDDKALFDGSQIDTVRTNIENDIVLEVVS